MISTVKKKIIYVFLFLILILAFSIILVSSNSASINNQNLGQLKVTLDHPFLINGKWINAEDLKLGDELTTIDDKKVKITGIEEVKEQVRVYNIEDEKYHNYVVDGGDGKGVIVHNSELVGWYDANKENFPRIRISGNDVKRFVLNVRDKKFYILEEYETHIIVAQELARCDPSLFIENSFIGGMTYIENGYQITLGGSSIEKTFGEPSANLVIKATKIFRDMVMESDVNIGVAPPP